MLHSSVVKRVTSVKYLGVLLDQYMDFTMHVDKLLKKAGSKLNFLFRNARFMNQHVRKLLCQSSMADGAFTLLLSFCNFIFVFSFIDFINELPT